MNRLCLFVVSDRYIEYLKNSFKTIYSKKNEKYQRKYVGVVLEINQFKYYVPLSSPKPSDYKIVNGKQIIRKSIIPIMRIIVKNNKGIDELKGTLRFSNMIPVPDSELVKYDIRAEQNPLYKDLVKNQLSFIQKNRDMIKNNVKMLYQQKRKGNSHVSYVDMSLDFQYLEELCKLFEEKF